MVFKYSPIHISRSLAHGIFADICLFIHATVPQIFGVWINTSGWRGTTKNITLAATKNLIMLIIPNKSKCLKT